jgi:hypothetical protein
MLVSRSATGCAVCDGVKKKFLPGARELLCSVGECVISHGQSRDGTGSEERASAANRRSMMMVMVMVITTGFQAILHTHCVEYHYS